MGIRGELYSTSVQLDNRTYFFNVKENRTGDVYLNIVESKKLAEKGGNPGGFERASIVVFQENAPAFLSGLDDALKAMEKQKRTKRATPAPRKRVQAIRKKRNIEPHEPHEQEN
jgi:hypothetical protein